MWASRIGRAGRRRSALVIALFSCLLAACTSVSVDREMGAMEQLPAPDRVLVYNFAVTPQEVQLDAVGSAITSTLDGTATRSRDPGRPRGGRCARQTAGRRHSKLGLYAERAAGPAPPTGTDVMILGQLVSIDEGNAAERMVIGLGAGRSDVQAHVQVYQSVSGRRTPSRPCPGPPRAA